MSRHARMQRAARSVPPAAAVRDSAQDQIWKVLDLTTGWSAHADAKAGLILAATSVVGGVLFSVAHGTSRLTAAVLCAAWACSLSVIAAGICAAAALKPRLRLRNQPASLIHFGDIAASHPDSPDAYIKALHELVDDDEALAAAISSQIWVNSLIVSRKYFWANLSLLALIAALASLGAVCAFRII